MATQIKVGKQFATVDDADAHLVAGVTWMLAKKSECTYAVSASRVAGKFLVMHRVIAGATEQHDVDHRNGNGLDNRRDNLRVCTRSQNLQNSRKHCKSSSRFKGVTRDKNRWRMEIVVRKQRIREGAFSTEEDAARRYDELAREHFGEYCRVNFPLAGELCALSN